MINSQMIIPDHIQPITFLHSYNMVNTQYHSIIDPFLVENFNTDSFYIDHTGTIRNSALYKNSPILFVLYPAAGSLVIVYNKKFNTNKGLFCVRGQAFYTLEGSGLGRDAHESITKVIYSVLGPLFEPVL